MPYATKLKRDEFNRRYYQSHKTYLVEQNTRWEQKNRHTPGRFATRLLHHAKTASKKLKIPCNLTHEWILEKIQTGYCEVTHLPFDLVSRPFKPSLDQRNPKRGYTTENVQLVVWIYNMAKFNFSHNDVVILAKAIVNV